jgi:hemolysin activation/secretion protein
VRNYRGRVFQHRIAATLTALAAVAFPAGVAFAQAIDIAPLVAPPVQKVTPPPTPEVLAPQPPAAPAAEAVPPGPPVRIDDVRVEGVTVYDPATIRSLYADLIGATVPRERLLAVVQALQLRYREDGYILTIVDGAAERHDGRLVFVIRATEGYIADVKLDGDIGNAGQLVLAMLDHLTAIRPVNNTDLERYLLLANDITGVTAQAVLSGIAPGGAVELVAKVARKPFAAQFQFDNRGSPEVGPYELLLTGQSNAFTSVGEQIGDVLQHLQPRAAVRAGRRFGLRHVGGAQAARLRRARQHPAGRRADRDRVQLRSADRRRRPQLSDHPLAPAQFVGRRRIRHL